LERFFWLYKSHLQKHLDNKDYFATNRAQYKPLR
jgi:hypothetical protein